MKYLKSRDNFQLSATDLSNYLNCRHLTNLDSLVAQGQLNKPIWNNPHASALQEMGMEHEADYLSYLRNQGFDVFEIDQTLDYAEAIKQTQQALVRGEEVIAQAVLSFGQWFARIDILRKRSGKGKLGDYYYEVLDTKLSHETKAGTILQLCLYSEMIEGVTGVLPEYMYVVTPGEPFHEQVYQVAQYLAYYRFVKQKLIADLQTYQETYPEPTLHCDICKWGETCDKVRRSDDHLCFVAGLTSKHRKELEQISISTLEQLATCRPAVIENLKGVNTESLLSVKEQAVLQLDARVSGIAKAELLQFEEGRGLARLPLPSEGDIFFDLEGDPYYRESGIEYLWGFSTFEEGKLHYFHRWAFDYQQELDCFKWFMGEVLRRKALQPTLKIYHYASYESSALKRLMGRYGACEDELDQLLRTGSFVDLYSITRQSVRAGIEKYSIKDLEQFYQYQRVMPLNQVGFHKRQIEHALELGHCDRILPQAKDAVLLYNQDDANSMVYLRQWLEDFRQQLIDDGEDINRPDELEGEISENLSDELIRINQLREKLQEGINPIAEERNESDAAKWLLGDLVGFYRREDKITFWEKFRLQQLDGLELLEDKSGISSAKFMQLVEGGTDRCPIHRYGYPDQLVDIRVGDNTYPEGDPLNQSVKSFGKVVNINYEEGTIDIKKSTGNADFHPLNFWAWNHIPTEKKKNRLYQFCESIIAHGIDGEDSPYKAAREILLKKDPDVKIDLKALDLSPLELTKTWALNLNNSYLAVQGPPGTGKSYTASRVILELVRKGYRIGVTGLSHKVITNLLEKVHQACGKEGMVFPIYQKTKDDEQNNLGICYLTKEKQIEEVLSGDGPFVFGATDFMWSSDYCANTLDYLVVDEAGQFSLVGILSIAHATRNFILLGDGAQLKQPIQGSHPEGAEVSALDHLAGEGKTLPPEKGVFLPITYRLHPTICQFNSEQFYEGRLRAIEGNSVQVISGHHLMAKKNLVVLTVDHQGNSNYSLEEVEAIKNLVNELVTEKNYYTVFDQEKAVTKRLDYDAIKIISPYNAQVNRLKRELPQVSIGTVDKFQGQEAPVIIYSVATSSPEEAPRGMDFLYSGNRLNVAVSRAECLFIMVATKAIFSPNCKTPGQMKLANAYCRFLEMADILSC